MDLLLRLLGAREVTARPSYAHHIRSVTDLATGQTQNFRVQVTSRDGLGRIRTTRTVSH